MPAELELKAVIPDPARSATACSAPAHASGFAAA